MKVFVRYNDNSNVELHNTYSIAIRRDNVVTGQVRPTSTNDIIKKFVKLYNAQIHNTKLQQYKLDEKDVHLALVADDNDSGGCTSKVVEYIALPSNLLLTDWFGPNNDSNTNKNMSSNSNHQRTTTADNTNNNSNTNLFYIRHGKPVSQFEFIRRMKDQIRSAINDGGILNDNDFVSPTTTTTISIPTSTRTSTATKTNAAKTTATGTATATATAKTKAKTTATAKTTVRTKVATASTCKSTSPSTRTTTKLSKEMNLPSSTRMINSSNSGGGGGGDNADQVAKYDSISLVEREFSFPIITLISQTQDNEIEMYCDHQVYHHQQQVDKNNNTVDNTFIDINTNVVVEEEEEEEKQCNVDKTTNYHDTTQVLDNSIGLPKVTTWIQFDKVQHSFGVDAYVYQEVLEEIRQSKQQSKQSTQSKSSSTRNEMLDYYFNVPPTTKKNIEEDGILTTQTNIQQREKNSYDKNNDDDNFVVQSRRIIRRTIYYPRTRTDQQQRQQQPEHPVYNDNKCTLTCSKDKQDTAPPTTTLVNIVKANEPMSQNITEIHTQDKLHVHKQAPTLDPSTIRSEEAVTCTQKRKFGSRLSSSKSLVVGKNLFGSVIRNPKTSYQQHEVSSTKGSISREDYVADTSTNSTNTRTTTDDILDVKSIQNTKDTKNLFQIFQIGTVKKIDNKNKSTAIKRNSIGQSQGFGFVMKQVGRGASAFSSSYKMKSKTSSRGTSESESLTHVDNIDEVAPYITLGLDNRKDEINKYISQQQQQQTPDKRQQLEQNCNEQQQHNELTRSTIEPVSTSNTQVTTTTKDIDDAKVLSQILSKKTNHVIQSASERLSCLVNAKRVDSLDLRKSNHEQECKKKKIVGPLRDTILAMKKCRSNTSVVLADLDDFDKTTGTGVNLSAEGQTQQPPQESIEDVSEVHRQEVDTIQQEDSKTHLKPEVEKIDSSCAIESSKKTISNISLTIEGMKKVDSLDVNRSIADHASKDNKIDPLLETAVGATQTIGGASAGQSTSTSDTNNSSVQLSDSIATSSNIEQRREIDNCTKASDNEPVSVVQVESNVTDGACKQISVAVPSGYENSTESLYKENDDDSTKSEILPLLFDSCGLKKFKLAFPEDDALVLAALSMNSNGEDVEARTRVYNTLHSDDDNNNKQMPMVDKKMDTVDEEMSIDTFADKMSIDTCNKEAEIKMTMPAHERKYSIDEVQALKEYLKTTGLSIDIDLFDEILSKMEAGNMEKSVEVILTQDSVALDETIHYTNVNNQTTTSKATTTTTTTTAPRQFFTSFLPKKRIVRVLADVDTDPEVEVQSTKTKTKTIILPFQAQYTTDQVQTVVEYMKSNNIPFDQSLFNDVIRSIHNHDHAETEVLVPVDARDDC